MFLHRLEFPYVENDRLQWFWDKEPLRMIRSLDWYFPNISYSTFTLRKGSLMNVFSGGEWGTVLGREG